MGISLWLPLKILLILSVQDYHRTEDRLNTKQNRKGNQTIQEAWRLSIWFGTTEFIFEKMARRKYDDASIIIPFLSLPVSLPLEYVENDQNDALVHKTTER